MLLTIFRYSRFVSLFPLLVALLAVTPGCTEGSKTSGASEKLRREVSDSLQAGNSDWVLQRLDRADRDASQKKDSDLWATTRVQRAVLGFYTAQPEQVVAQADSALRWLKANTENESRLRDLGKAYQAKSGYYTQYNYDPDSARRYQRLGLDAALRNRTQPNDLLLAYGNYADMLRQTGQLDSAALYYQLAISLADSIGVPAEQTITLSNGLGGVFSDLRDFETSSVWFKRSLANFEKAMPHEKFTTLSAYGSDCYYRGDFEESKKINQRLARMLDSIPGTRWERMFTSVNLADASLMLGQIPEAAQLLDTAARYFSTEQPNPICTSYINSLQIRRLIGENRLQEAGMIAGTDDGTRSLRPEQQLARLKAKGEYFAAAGMWQKAYEAERDYEALQDSLRSQLMAQRISALNARFQHDSRLLRLKADNDRKQTRILRLIAVVVISVLVIFALVVIASVVRHRARRHSRIMYDKIISLKRENLRSRITPHFIYNALNHDLAGEKGIPAKRLHALVELLRRQQYLESEIMVPLCEELAFVNDYITVESANVPGPFDATVNVDPSVDTSKIMIPSMCLQILVENAFKHGISPLPEDMPKKLHIDVKPAAGGIEVRVISSGAPAPRASRRSGLGLRIIMETLSMLNEKRNPPITFTMHSSETGDATIAVISNLTAN